MLSLARIIVYLLEGLSITVAIYLITKRQLRTPELVTLALGISVTFMILDLFAPGVASGARQGSGFGLGYAQFGGNPTGMPLHYYGNQSVQSGGNPTGMPQQYYGDQSSDMGSCKNGQCLDNSVLEGMDDPVALQYYQQYNPYHEQLFPNSINTQDIDQGAPRTLEQVTPITTRPITAEPIAVDALPQKQNTEGFQGNLGCQYAKNPFQTGVRSFSEVERPGAGYENGLGTTTHSIAGTCSTQNVLYSPLTPEYGYRYQLPRGWDELEQPNLNKATDFFTRKTC